MKLVIGLGNPGNEYTNTRHNIGFMAVDALHRRHSFSEWKEKFNGLFASGNIDGQKILLLKPQTFMNLSGKSVQAACTFYKIKPEDIFVFHDEIDIALGKVKIKLAGGDAGHNGLKSITGALGKNYTRIRLGVGRPELKAQVSGYVLGNFTKAQQPIVDQTCDAITSVFPLILNGEDAKALNDYAMLMKQ